jgi:hypothetical protein
MLAICKDVAMPHAAVRRQPVDVDRGNEEIRL